MPYTTWTQKDLEKYKGYVDKISYQQIGVINISGIYKKSEPGKERSVSAYVFRVYDDNKNCPDRQFLSPNANIALSTKNGVAKGLVVMIAKDSKTGDFFNVKDSNIANPAAAWIASKYTNGVEVIAEHVMRGHQGSLHSDCFTLSPQGVRSPVLNGEHIDKYILPPVVRSLSPEIRAADMKTGHPMMSMGGVSDEEASGYTMMSGEDLQAILGEDFVADSATVGFEPTVEEPKGPVEQENSTEQQTGEQQDSVYAQILGRLGKRETSTEATSPVDPTTPLEQ